MWVYKWNEMESEEVHVGVQVERLGTNQEGHRMCTRYSEAHFWAVLL